MAFENNIRLNLHKYWTERIEAVFTDLGFMNSNYLSLIEYVENIPQKFYSTQSYNFFKNALAETSTQFPKFLVDYFNNESNRWDLAFATLDDINISKDHDDPFPDSDLELLEFSKRSATTHTIYRSTTYRANAAPSMARSRFWEFYYLDNKHE